MTRSDAPPRPGPAPSLGPRPRSRVAALEPPDAEPPGSATRPSPPPALSQRPGATEPLQLLIGGPRAGMPRPGPAPPPGFDPAPARPRPRLLQALRD